MSDVNKKLLEALRWAVREYEKNACAHEDTKRLGFCWTECSVCGKRWADDEGGFVPYEPPAELDAAHAAIARAEAELANEASEAKADDDGWIKWEGGECPVDQSTLVEVKTCPHREIDTLPITFAGDLEWSHAEKWCDPIIAYRIVGAKS